MFDTREQEYFKQRQAKQLRETLVYPAIAFAALGLLFAFLFVYPAMQH